MKLKTEQSTATTVGMEKPRGFRFEFNETMFDMLSNRTYTDPIRAVIRELACNASDAHEMAGVANRRFEIHLPTPHEPEFYIQDYGVGMNDEEIDNLFTMYGGSNKRESENTIGALGIGSKSPFAYLMQVSKRRAGKVTKGESKGGQYTVRSVKDGVTYMYVAREVNGMPELAPTSVTQTPKAPNGVKISFAVDEQDFWEFENKAKVALEFFEPLPVINVQGFQPHKQSYILKNSKWGLRKEAQTAAHGYHCRAIMGKVQYQIGEIDESRTNSLQRKILSMPIDLFFPLGSLDFAASRESLQINERTVNAILQMVDEIAEESIQEVKNKINACKDVWDAQVLLFSLLNQTKNSYGNETGMSALIREALNNGKLYGKYANFDLAESQAVINTLAYSHINISKFEHSSRGAEKRASKAPFFVITAEAMREEKKLAKTDPMVEARHKLRILVKPTVLFIINDTKFPGDKYVHYHIQEAQKGVNDVYMIHRPKSEPDTDLAQVVKNGKRLVADIGGAPVIMLSELVTAYAAIFAQRRATSTTTRRTHAIAVLKSNVDRSRRSNVNGWAKAWEAPDEDEIADGTKKFYVATDKMVGIHTGFDKAWDFRSFVDHVVAAGKFGIHEGHQIYGIRSNHKLLKNNKGEWVELMSHVYHRAQEIMTPEKTLAASLHITPFNDELSELLAHLASEQPLTCSPMQQFAVELAEAKSHRIDHWAELKWVLDFCASRGKYVQSRTADFNRLFQRVKAGYPMLQYVGGYSLRRDEGIKTVVEYIRQVDEQNFRQAACVAAASNQ